MVLYQIVLFFLHLFIHLFIIDLVVFEDFFQGLDLVFL